MLHDFLQTLIFYCVDKTFNANNLKLHKIYEKMAWLGDKPVQSWFIFYAWWLKANLCRRFVSQGIFYLIGRWTY